MNYTRTIRSGVALAAAVLLIAAPAVWANDSLNQGMSHFKSGKYAEAAAEFQALVDGAPNYDYGYFMLGMSFLQMGKPKDAETNILKAVELNGDKFEYHNGLARVYFDQKQYPKSIAALKTAEPLAGDDRTKFALYSMRGFSYAALEKWGDAVEDLEKARALNPSSGSVLVTMGKAYYSLGHNDKAVPVFRSAIKAVPTDQATLHLLGEALINMGAEATSDSQKSSLYSEALGVAEKFQQLSPGSFDANNLAGRAALGSKDYSKAEQAFRKVLAQKSDYCFAMVNLGKTYLAQSRWKDAESILNDAATCAPRMAVVHESLGFALQKQNRLDDAIKAYEKAYQLKPSESIRAAIDTAKTNLEVRAHNESVAAVEAEQTEAEIAAQRKYDEELAKQREWEERRKKDD